MLSHARLAALLFLQANGTPKNSLSDFQQKVVVAFVAGVLAYIAAVLVDRRKRDREPKKEISYDLSTTEPLVDIEQQVRDKVSLLYDGIPAKNIFYTICNITNTGNELITDELIMFIFAKETQFLAFRYDPEPRLELGVQEVSSGTRASIEKHFRIGSIAPGDTIGFRFFLSHSTSPNVLVKTHNSKEHAQFVARAAKKAIDERRLLRKFAYCSILLTLVSMFNLPVFVNRGFDEDPIRQLVVNLINCIRLSLVLYLIAKTWAIARIAADIVSSSKNAKRGTQLDIHSHNLDGAIFLVDSPNAFAEIRHANGAVSPGRRRLSSKPQVEALDEDAVAGEIA